MFKSNLIRVTLGLLVGFPFYYWLDVLLKLPWYLIVIVQWLFYIIFYSGIDKLMENSAVDKVMDG